MIQLNSVNCFRYSMFDVFDLHLVHEILFTFKSIEKVVPC